MFFSFALILSFKPQLCSLFVLMVAWDILGGLANLEQPLGELLPMGSLPEERSKATGASLRVTQKQAVKLPPLAVRPPASIHQQSDRLPNRSDCQRLEQKP
jgi:hypothetical protein